MTMPGNPYTDAGHQAPLPGTWIQDPVPRLPLATVLSAGSSPGQRRLPRRRGAADLRRRHGLFLSGALLAIVGLLAVLAMSVRATSSGSIHLASAPVSQDCRTLGVSFYYPAGWQRYLGRNNARIPGSSAQLCRTALFIDPSDAVFIDAYALPNPASAEGAGPSIPLLKREAGQLLAQIGATPEAGPRMITIGGLPGIEVRGAGYAPSGAPIQSTLVVAYDGRIEYLVKCQAQEHAAQVMRACDQILRTFTANTAR